MSENQTTRVLNQLVGPICRTINPASAQAWVQLQVDQAVQDRVEVLAEKCNKGMLSAEEREEYETYIRASNFIGLLKAEARVYLKNHSQA